MDKQYYDENKGEFNIELVKKHIKNLMAGTMISRNDILELYQSVAKEQVERRVLKLFASQNIERTIENLVRSTITKYINDLINKDRGHWSSGRTNIEDMIMEECRKQVESQIREHFKITVKGKEQFGERNG
ncbi:hypothetical protein ACX818_001430 [Acinetobacter baumannii]